MRAKDGKIMLALWKILMPEDYRIIAAPTRASAAYVAEISEEIVVRMPGCYATGKARVIK